MPDDWPAIVEALTRAGRLGDAQLALEKTSTYANHVGLYAEQVRRPATRRETFRRPSRTLRSSAQR